LALYRRAGLTRFHRCEYRSIRVKAAPLERQFRRSQEKTIAGPMHLFGHRARRVPALRL